jgi:predicted metal-dependent phosphoesterase TrpH
VKPLTTTHLVLAADASIDLQMHTTYSDGVWAPEQLIDYLAGEQFGLVAITDHDRVDTVAALQQLATEKQLPVLVAAEMSTSWRGEATDVLCYGFDPQGNELQDLTQDVLSRQRAIVLETYENLQHKGYAFPRKLEVLKESGGEPREVNDLVRLVSQHGYGSDPEASAKIVFDVGFLWATNDIAVIVDAMHRSGGVCLIAHPGRGGGNLTRYDVSLLDQLLAEVPIDGFEAYYPVHTPEQTAMYLEYAQKHQLLTSSGSDSHSPEKKPIKYRAELSRRLLERVGIQVK